MKQTIYTPEIMTIDTEAYAAGEQYAELIADGFASAAFDAVFEAAMLSSCAYSFYAGLNNAMVLESHRWDVGEGWNVSEQDSPERRDEDREQEGQDNGEREPEREPEEVAA